jgi:hypothetical protein
VVIWNVRENRLGHETFISAKLRNLTGGELRARGMEGGFLRSKLPYEPFCGLKELSVINPTQ